jgi:hypothetical protein
MLRPIQRHQSERSAVVLHDSMQDAKRAERLENLPVIVACPGLRVDDGLA